MVSVQSLRRKGCTKGGGGGGSLSLTTRVGCKGRNSCSRGKISTGISFDTSENYTGYLNEYYRLDSMEN